MESNQGDWYSVTFVTLYNAESNSCANNASAWVSFGAVITTASVVGVGSIKSVVTNSIK